MPLNQRDDVPAAISLALADKLFAAIDANDLEMLRRDVYSPDVVVWHNNDEHEQLLDENLRVLDWLHRKVAGKRYEDVRRQATQFGFVEQHVLRGTAPSGGQLNVLACLVVTIEGERIVRIDEYLDSAALAPLSR
jgi:ketosteroid isomerase-like protein